MFAIIEHHFEQPVAPQPQIFARLPGRAIAIPDVFQEALWKLFGDQPVSLVGCRPINVGIIFWFVLVKDGIPFVVIAFANEPCEHTCRIGRIGDPGVVKLAVVGRNIILGDGAPMAEAGLFVQPSFYAREQSFDPWPIAVNCVARLAYRRVERLTFPSYLTFDKDRDQVLGAG